MYSVELNGGTIRQAVNFKAMLAFYRRKLCELSGRDDELCLLHNGKVIISNKNKIYNCDETEE